MTERINIKDWERIQAKYSSLYQTINNGMSRMSKVMRNVQTFPYCIGLDVPDGRELFVFDRRLQLSEGDFNIDVVLATNGFTGGTVSRKSRLRAGSVNTIQSNLYMVVTSSGTISVLDEDFVDTGTALGSARTGGAPAVEGVIVSIMGKSMLRITSQNVDPITVGIRLLVWETSL